MRSTVQIFPPAYTLQGPNQLIRVQQIGNAVGGITDTAGGIIGAAGRGTGKTVNKSTRTRKGGDGIKDMTGGIERGIGKIAKGIERGSVGKKP